MLTVFMSGQQFPSLRARALLRVLKREPLSYVIVRQSGSHRRMESENGYEALIFAFHDGDTLPPGLVRKILTKDVGLSIEEALDLL